MSNNNTPHGSAQVAERQAGDAWLEYIKQFPKLDEFWNNIPEPTNIWLRQQIDIFAGKYPTAASEEIEDLKRWKAEALAVMPDFQEIGKLLGVPLGQSVHDKIIPGIKALQAQHLAPGGGGTTRKINS